MKDIHRVVISHHQSNYINKFSDDVDTVFVFDDLTESDRSCVLDRPYVTRPIPGNRGANRNAGLSYLESNRELTDDSIIEFFDGDRVPLRYPLDKIEKALNDGADCLLYFCMDDSRNRTLKGDGIVPEKANTSGISNPFFSCGLAMKYRSIKRIKSFNNGQFFEEGFPGWGFEDQYMGIVCAKLGVKCMLFPGVRLFGAVGGDVQDHDDYVDTLQYGVNIIYERGLEDVAYAPLRSQC